MRSPPPLAPPDAPCAHSTLSNSANIRIGPRPAWHAPHPQTPAPSLVVSLPRCAHAGFVPPSPTLSPPCRSHSPLLTRRPHADSAPTRARLVFAEAERVLAPAYMYKVHHSRCCFHAELTQQAYTLSPFRCTRHRRTLVRRATATSKQANAARFPAPLISHPTTA
ncbi:hypothetical protein C8R43DRAFT_1130689 [Mycena crocata]|nr:hypothetical protein C8R43DRAFT_1130689 [Mycena crocata]